MVVGTGSHVGKSVLVTGLCRVFRRRGIAVAPFKAQNMALNSGITPAGGEIGRAQISQAEAAGLEPHVDMNPVLLKPTSDLGSQVIVQGKVLGNYKGVDYYRQKPRLLPKVMQSFRRLQAAHQLIVLEGAGSCAELNLKRHDLVNMSMARRAGAKVILVADIDAGGVFGQVLGSLSLLTPSERRLVAGVVVNKFRGDAALFDEGIRIIERRGHKPVLGLLPFFRLGLPQEDGVALERGAPAGGGGALRVGVARLSRISNFTDVDCLAAEPAVDLRWVERPEQLAGLDLLILPGTKNTLAALAGLKQSGLFAAIQNYHALGGHLLGLCGGYQLLGRAIADPLGVEGPPASEQGLGLLPVHTVMAGEKTTTRVTAAALPGLPFAAPGHLRGYEIHMGQTSAQGTSRPAFQLQARLDQPVDLADGQVSPEGRVVGTYLHGILDNDTLRAGLLAWAGGGQAISTLGDYAAFKDRQYDLLADLLEEHLRLDGLLEPLA
ncbi:MAG: cobyric acid synthase [Desulfarculus sp.]|nr:cobyric acid synthase [Desulfarculus sp.]